MLVITNKITTTTPTTNLAFHVIKKLDSAMEENVLTITK